MTESNTAAVAQQYYEAMSSGDIPTATGLFAPDIAWHQPGGHRFAGLKDGAAAVGEMIGGQMDLTAGTFALKFTGGPMINGDLAAFPVHFSGEREGAEMSMDGIDVLRVEGGKIAEMWLFSADQDAEDAFWGQV
ncbi:nuclear transport factor 2 family protein [Glycomyces buryatensis]|uniref:Nuclear transport factor 2 family protein n=1 Tax=Glycomyces buryatensis TaxID=2570927 RepID=A0A4S8QK60_9ACTN|nr:nuclear transport factor 2 family protein [Glycomyces buryatensis]THV41809.1 nuclear transport factor 2 family protein [Glycomyces buryatensis]